MRDRGHELAHGRYARDVRQLRLLAADVVLGGAEGGDVDGHPQRVGLAREHDPPAGSQVGDSTAVLGRHLVLQLGASVGEASREGLGRPLFVLGCNALQEVPSAELLRGVSGDHLAVPVPPHHPAVLVQHEEEPG